MPTDIESEVLRWLSWRSLTTHEVRQRLLRRGTPLEEIEALISHFVASGYLDDRQVAEATVADALRRLKGPRYIWARLMQRGIPPAFIEEIMADLERQVDWLAIAERLRPRYDRSNVLDPTRWLRHLAREGFPTAVIRHEAEVGQRSDGNGVEDC